MNDTIGFIRDLPPDLIAAFASTLEDSIEADLLLHVIDSSDPDIEGKMQVVNDTLRQIGADAPFLLVFNKCDSVTPDAMVELANRYSNMNPVFVSAVSGA